MQSSLFALILLTFSLFNANDGRNSIVSIGFQTFNLSGYNRFIENKGPALRVSVLIDLNACSKFLDISRTTTLPLLFLYHRLLGPQ